MEAAVRHMAQRFQRAAELQAQQAQQGQQQGQQQAQQAAPEPGPAGKAEADGLAGRVGAPELASRVAAALVAALELAPSPPPAARAALGHNCHLPTSLQTALHVLLHLEGGGWREPHPQPDALAGRAGAGSPQDLQQQGGSGGGTDAAEASAGAAPEDPAAFCLPCSLGGPGSGACAWQPRGSAGLPVAAGEAAEAAAPQAAAAAASGAGVAAEGEAEAAPAGGPRLATERGYVGAVRAALREGGCCASRAAFVGACLGALGGEGVVPRAWRRRVTGVAGVEGLVEQLCSLRGE